ncbi:MAG: InlB B-repeat-containing protein [Clostridia bacterium]|nr:InlB B-repeat-containing protein [Clostridia bacterium]
MKTKFKSKLLSILLVLVMVLSIVPFGSLTAFAAETLSGGKAEWNVQLSDEGVLTWNDMGSATYNIDVDETETGGTVTKIQGISGTSYNLIDRFKELKLENGTYYFYIKANDTDATSGDISFRYVSQQDKLSAPLNLHWDGTVAKWNSVANATGYTVYLYTDDGYLQLTKTTTEPQYDWTTEAEDGRWFEVVATADNYRDSNPTEGPRYGTYSWTAPTLTGGKAEWNVTLSDDGMLRWNDMSSATYDISVDETEMGGTVTNIYNINTNAFNLINRFKELKLENGTYYFSIKANDTDATSGNISFKYVSPEDKLPAPQNLTWNGTVAKWDSVANATEYKVILYTESGSVQLSKTTTETQYDWTTQATDGRWFEVVATADNYRDSNPAESPKYVVVSYSVGAYPYDATVSKTQAGGQVYLTTDEGTDGWSSDGYIKKATEGTTVTLNANPAAGYKFVEWRQGTAGATISTEANYQFTASEDKYLYAVFEAISTTEYQIELQIFDITYTATAGGTLKLETNKGSAEGTNPKAYATEDTAVTITAVPAQGYEFVAWKKYTPHYSTAFSTEATYTFTASDPAVIPSDDPPLFLYAVFQEVQQIVPTYEINCVSHNLSSNETGGTVMLETDKGGTGYAASQQQYATENTNVRVLAVAEPGYQFVAWRKGSPTDANATVSTNTEYQFTATEAVWMYAVFEYTPECTIDCTVFDITNGINNGQIGVGGTVSIQTDKGSVEGATPLPIQATRNSSVTVNAVAASGYEFLGWKKASPYVQDFVATTASYTFDINEELYLYAVFQEASTSEYIVSYNKNGGSGTMVGDMVEENGKFTLENCTYIAPEGYKFKAWAIGSVNGEQKQPGEQITITADTDVYAIWEVIPHECSGVLESGQGATCTVDGWKDYYRCGCGKYYEDANCQTPINDLEAWKVGAGKTTKDHEPNADDGDCTTAITCSVCGTVTTAANATHTGGTATCEHKAECTVCGKEYGNLANHIPNADDGDCTTAITCSVCGTVTTAANATHTGGTATCEHKAECTVCGKKYGELADHSFVEGKCECGETDPNYVPPHEHNFVEGKCECGETDPNYTPGTDTPGTDVPGTDVPGTDKPEDPDDGLSGGAIAGIVAGSVVVLGGGGFALWWFVFRKKKLF